MASLKEIKTRIGSVQSTLKITSAMKIVASTKLKRAQVAIQMVLPYERQMNRILTNFLSAENSNIESPYIQDRKEKKIAIVTVASNSSLCGGYNSEVIRNTTQLLKEYEGFGKDNVTVYPIGRKVAQTLNGNTYSVADDYKLIGDKPNYKDSSELARKLMDLYMKKEIDKVELVYMHFVSTGVQLLRKETFLPLQLPKVNPSDSKDEFNSDYIFEPSQTAILNSLLPEYIRFKIFTALLDASTSEHAARMVAMQQATDNGNDLLQDLNIAYNKGRQQAITNELLDIVGGSMK